MDEHKRTRDRSSSRAPASLRRRNNQKLKDDKALRKKTGAFGSGKESEGKLFPNYRSEER